MTYGTNCTQNVGFFCRPPLYSLFAGLIAAVSETAINFYLESLIFILFSVSVYFFLKIYGETLTFLSALLIAASPVDALYNGRVLSESLVTPMLVLGSLFFINAKTAKEYLFSDALLGAATLTRDVYLLLPLCFCW